MSTCHPRDCLEKIRDLPCWPDQWQVLLLRAALAPPEEATHCWRQWRERVDVERLDAASYRLLPLAYHNIQQHCADQNLDRFKGIYRQSWLRNQLISRQIQAIETLLNDIDVPHLYLKGVPLAFHYYDNPALRPLGDLDILVHPADASRVLEHLQMDGYEYTYHYLGSENRQRYTHSADLQKNGEKFVDIHWFALVECCDERMQTGYWRFQQDLSYRDIHFPSPSATELLFHTLVHGSRWDNVASLRWIADTRMILDKASIDWDRLVATCMESRLVVPMYATLNYYETLFPGEIPATVLESLAATPVERKHVKEFVVRGREKNYWNRIQVHWLSYRRIKDAEVPDNKLTFLRYLMFRWGVESASKLPVYVCTEWFRRKFSQGKPQTPHHR